MRRLSDDAQRHGRSRRMSTLGGVIALTASGILFCWPLIIVCIVRYRAQPDAELVFVGVFPYTLFVIGATIMCMSRNRFVRLRWDDHELVVGNILSRETRRLRWCELQSARLTMSAAAREDTRVRPYRLELTWTNGRSLTLDNGQFWLRTLSPLLEDVASHLGHPVATREVEWNYWGPIDARPY